MRRVAEIMHIVEAERENFLNGLLNPDEETQKIQWLCGVRKQQYFSLNELIFMTFEYEGNDFNSDMAKLASYLESKGHLIKERRKDVPLDKRDTTNWWAPVKKLGTLLDTKPKFIDNESELQSDYMEMLDGCMTEFGNTKQNLAYDEDDWSESIHIYFFNLYCDCKQMFN